MHALKCSLIFIFLIVNAQCISFKATQKTLNHDAKRPMQPLMVNLKQTKRSTEAQKQFFSLLQQERAALKTMNFLQTSTDEQMTDISNKTALVALKNILNTQYIGQIAIGNKDNTFSVIFDTGSTPFFIDSSLCSQAACMLRNQFNPKSSQSLVMTDPSVGLKVVYGSGELDGVMAAEDVYLGDIKASQMNLFLIDDQIGVLDYGGFDGVVGLSFPQETTAGPMIYSVFDLVKNQFPQPYFSFSLKRNDEAGSYAMFGGYNRDDITEDLRWHDVIDTTYWMLKLTNLFVGDKAIDMCKEKRCGIIIDSGTSIMTAPKKALVQMTELTGDMSCYNLDALPNISLEIDDKRYDLTPQEYIVTTSYDGTSEFYQHSKDFVDCSGLFTPMNLATEDDVVVFILGDLFFTKYYTVFDMEKRKIGMAPQKR